jgi:DNA-binding NarL/FixJ family response regulator
MIRMRAFAGCGFFYSGGTMPKVGRWEHVVRGKYYLTPREVKVLRLAADEMSTTQIAAEMGVSTRSVKDAKLCAKQRLLLPDTASAQEVIDRARELGFLE